MDRMVDPKWLETCRLWDQLTDGQRRLTVLAMRQMVSENKEKGEEENGTDTTATSA